MALTLPVLPPRSDTDKHKESAVTRHLQAAPDGQAPLSLPEAPPALAKNSARGGACRDLKCEGGAPPWHPRGAVKMREKT